MKRLNKLYETRAMISQSQGRLTLLQGMKLNATTRKILRPDLQAAYDALEKIIDSLDTLIEKEQK